MKVGFRYGYLYKAYPAESLHVELSPFSAAVNGVSVTLNWQTATEVDNCGFEIERASTPLGMTWEKIGFV